MNPLPDESARRPAEAEADGDGPEPAHTVRMNIEVQVGTEPVRGRIGPAGVEREFVGWTELATAIEECTHPGREVASSPSAGSVAAASTVTDDQLAG